LHPSVQVHVVPPVLVHATVSGSALSAVPDGAAGAGLEFLCVPKFEVDLEFSGGPSEPGIVDVAVNVSVDGGQRGT